MFVSPCFNTQKQNIFGKCNLCVTVLIVNEFKGLACNYIEDWTEVQTKHDFGLALHMYVHIYTVINAHEIKRLYFEHSAYRSDSSYR